MRSLIIICVNLLILGTMGCGSVNEKNGQEYTGVIKPAGITSYQYGTHRLEAGDDIYALKSDNISLDDYEDQNVSITAFKIDGYPLDGGPVYLNVTKVKN